VIYTAKRLAELCDCTLATINRKAHEIGGRKVGRGWVFSEEAVNSWLNAKPRKPGRPRKRIVLTTSFQPVSTLADLHSVAALKNYDAR
jgi:hypothetical protein